MRRHIVIERAERLHQIPPYPTREVDRYKRRLNARGIDPIDLTVGGIDPTPHEFVIARLCETTRELGRTTAARSEISAAFRQAFSAWFTRRFDVDLDPQTQVLPLVGAKTGVACLPLALVNPGETVLLPDPAYPAYRTGTIFAGGAVQTMPLLERNDCLPNLRQIDPEVAHRAKLMFLSYPNNPTGAVADLPFFRTAVDFARRHNIIVCHDAAHFLMAYDGYDPPSFMQAPGACDVGVEVFSLAFLLGGTLWELGVAVGSPSVLAALAQLTDSLDTGLFLALQQAGTDALTRAETLLADLIPRYAHRRDILVDGLQTLGWKVRKPKAGLYVWVPIPPRYSSVRFSILLRKAGVFVVPGGYMGEYGEGYVRFALSASDETLATVVRRVEQSLSRYRFRRLHPPQFTMV